MRVNQLGMIRQLLEGIQPRSSVMMLARLMEFKLQQNSHKRVNWPSDARTSTGERDWADLFPKYLLQRLTDEVNELEEAVEDLPYFKGDPMAVALECADVANFAMMLADNALAGRIPGTSYPEAVDAIKEDFDEEESWGGQLERDRPFTDVQE